MTLQHIRSFINTLNKPKPNQILENGSMMLLTLFVFLVVSLITISLWKLIEFRIKLSLNQEHHLRAKYAARSGIEDAIIEIKAGNSWVEGSTDISSEWTFLSDNTFYKTNSNDDSLTFFDYPVTFSVTLNDGNEDNMYSITSTGAIRRNDASSSIFYSTYQATILQSFNGEILVLDLKEI
tara:strand:+ start:807 stop:1346 length:540 start_codon:yes stop_codon:yes gene_type:complete